MRRILFVSFALALIPSLAAAAEPFGKPLQKICAEFQSDGWTAPANPLTQKRGKAEMSIPGKLYICMLAREMKPAGSGHAPDLQALLSETREERSIVLSAHIWCAADRAATFDALAKQLERVAGNVPEPIASALRAGKEAKATAGGLAFEVAPVEVDSEACENVPPGQLGPVLMELDVAVKTVK
ncbi:MAG: hypothetical protein ACJ76N_00400 [Thermoanaerobaculia bacterium]